MKFSEMIINAGKEISGIKLASDFEVGGLSYNSAKTKKGDVFFAVRGFRKDGNDYIGEAARNGAGAFFSDRLSSYEGITVYRVDDCRRVMAVMSNVFYGFPSRNMKVIGVTGTNGKTTVTSLINHILESAGKRTGLIGTNMNIVGGRKLEAEFTTPESVELNSLLSLMHKEGVDHVTMEVSSHALALKRVYGLEFDVAVFTNLTPEHLDFHTSIENYFVSKKLLFDSMPAVSSKGFNTRAIYNSDDEYGMDIVKDCKSEKISFGPQGAAYSAENLKMGFDGMNFDMLVRSGSKINRVTMTSNLTGRFNTYNILAASAAAECMGVDYELIRKAVKNFAPVEGRFNQSRLSNGALAIVDYSHTPDSLRKTLAAVREILTSEGSNGRIITVFGCGGNRDRKKRPEMGRIAAENSDAVVITSDNPRDEDPYSIIDEIKAGISGRDYFVEADREKAIIKAIEASRAGDVILVAGKGHETYQEVKGVKYHLSDKEIVERFKR